MKKARIERKAGTGKTLRTTLLLIKNYIHLCCELVRQRKLRKLECIRKWRRIRVRDPKYRKMINEKAKERAKERRKNPEYRARLNKYEREWRALRKKDPKYLNQFRAHQQKYGKKRYLMKKKDPDYLKRLLFKRRKWYVKARQRARERYHYLKEINPNFLKQRRDATREKYSVDPAFRMRIRAYQNRRYRLNSLNRRLAKIMVALPKINDILSHKGE